MRVVHSLCHEPGKKTAFKTLQAYYPIHSIRHCSAMHATEDLFRVPLIDA
jgi:hypothetical protein